MAKKVEEEASGGLPGWLATYGDLATLLLCFFVLLYSMSNVDVTKYKAAVSSFNNQIDIMPGGEALTGGELITNGVSQLGEIQEILENKNPTTDDSDSEVVEEGEPSSDESKTSAAENAEQSENSNSESANFTAESGQIAKEIKAYLIENGIESEVALSYNSNYVKMTLEGEVLFDVGKASIKTEAESLLAVIKDMIIDKGYERYKMQIEGHTDNWDINTVQFPSNWYLSAARAIAVGDIFIEKYGFDPENIACTGYGEFNPIASNDTAEGRATNRRVEIKLIIETEEIVPDDVVLQ